MRNLPAATFKLTQRRAHFLAIFAIVFATSTVATATHTPGVPAGYHWGRCLLQIDGRKYINGHCAYQIDSDGSLELDGPHQIWEDPSKFPQGLSNDYFVQLDVKGSSADAFWNEEIRNSHAQAYLGNLKRHGACWTNARTKVCLWKQ